MKQLSLFPLENHEANILDPCEGIAWVLCVDGAARGNPGLAGAGIFITKDGIPFIKEGYFLGKKTNNQAEYLALLVGLYIIGQHVRLHDSVSLISDSLLLVRQLQGVYRVRHAGLQLLHVLAKSEMTRMNATVTHVLRECNVDADQAANHGIDTRNVLASDCLMWLYNHAIIV